MNLINQTLPLFPLSSNSAEHLKILFSLNQQMLLISYKYFIFLLFAVVTAAFTALFFLCTCVLGC